MFVKHNPPLHPLRHTMMDGLQVLVEVLMAAAVVAAAVVAGKSSES